MGASANSTTQAQTVSQSQQQVTDAAHKPSSEEVAQAMDTIHRINELNANAEDY